MHWYFKIKPVTLVTLFLNVQSITIDMLVEVNKDINFCKKYVINVLNVD